MIFDGDCQAFPKFVKQFWDVSTLSQKEVRDEVDFLHAKHQSFLQVDYNTLDIKFSYKVILALLMDMIKHSQSTESKKFAISLQYLEKEVRDGVHFLHADKHQSFYKLALLILMEVARHVQCAQNKKLLIYLQYLKKNVSQLLLCSIVMQNIEIFYRDISHVRWYLVFPCFHSFQSLCFASTLLVASFFHLHFFLCQPGPFLYLQVFSVASFQNFLRSFYSSISLFALFALVEMDMK